MTKESPSKDKIILVVDDEPDIQETPHELLDMAYSILMVKAPQ